MHLHIYAVAVFVVVDDVVILVVRLAVGVALVAADAVAGWMSFGFNDCAPARYANSKEILGSFDCNNDN